MTPKEISPKKRSILLILIMTSVVIIVESITIEILYNTAFNEETLRLVETAKSQARLIEAVARFDKKYSNAYPYGARMATLIQIRDAHLQYDGFGKTGEFTLSTRIDDQIVFILTHRHYDLNNPKPVAWDSNLAEPMRLALSGKSGTIVGLDYRGEKVLAAYEPISELNIGIVAKIDLWEIRAPFINAAILSGLIAVGVILFGAGIFFKAINPMIQRLNDSVTRMQTAITEVKSLRGILPICSYCKKIRDDKGYWDQVDVYVRQHTDVEFSHSICPECATKHYGPFYDSN